MFLVRNGVKLPQDDGSVYSAMIAIANKELNKSGLAEVLRKLAQKNR